VQFQIGGRGRDKATAAAELLVFEKKLAELEKRKIPVVVGAGDDIDSFGTSDIDKLLKKHDNVVIATSTDKDDNVSYIARYARTGVHTAAPGEGIMTTMPGNKYGEVNGTAYAAAHVTAALALAKAKFADKIELPKLISTLLSDSGSDYLKGLERVDRGSNRLNVVKYMAALSSLK